MSVQLDENELALESRKRNQIRNNTSHEKEPFQLIDSHNYYKSRFEGIRLRSLTATYNCVGMVVASRRCHVDPGLLEFVLSDDGYRRIERKDVEDGDLIVYRDGGEVQHVGVVVSKSIVTDDQELGLTILSKWGDGGEYVHPAEQVPSVYGNEIEFWTERRVQ